MTAAPDGLVRKFDHVALAVRDLPRAVALFQDVLGFTFVGGGDNPELLVRAIQLRAPGSIKVELLSPTSPDSYLSAYLDRKGEGFHHMTAYVDDVAAAAGALEAAGYGTVDTTTARDSWHETFLRPSAAFGALVQLARAAVPWTGPLQGVTAQDVLDGRVSVLANHVTWTETGEVILPAEAAT